MNTPPLAHNRPRSAWISPARPLAVRSRHNVRVNSFSTLEVQLESEDASLQALIACIAKGGSDAPSALSALYDATVQRVYSLVRRFVPDDAAAQDVTQDVFFQAWTQAARFDGQRGAAMAWLLNLARSRALDAWRKQSSSPVLMNSDVAEAAAQDWSGPAQPADLLEACDTQHHLHAALETLPVNTRHMLSLAFFQDMSHADISAHLGLPLGTVKSTVRRALLSLREHLQTKGLGVEHLAALALEQ
jgi:RNA polymerase sigma factor (sigma-70 family)